MSIKICTLEIRKGVLMYFCWDEKKSEMNKKKHGISFDVAMQVFFDEKRIEKYDEKHSTLEEERTIVIGRGKQDFLILFVVSTNRNGMTRIISARKAEKKEELEYYGNYDT